MAEPSISREPGPERKAKAAPHFWRALGYLRPYRRKVVVSIAAAFVAGAFFTGGLAAALPVVNTLLQGDTPRTWADRKVVQGRLGVTLADDPGVVRVVRVRAGGVAAREGWEDGRLLASGPATAPWLAAAAGAGHGQAASDGDLLVLTPVPTDLPEPPLGLRLLRGTAYRLPADPVWAVASIMGVILCLTMLTNVVRFVHAYESNVAALSAINDLRRHLFARTLRMPLSDVGRMGSGDVTSRLVNDAQQLQEGFKTLLGRAVQEPIIALFALGFALVLDWRLTIFILAFVPLMVVTLQKFAKRMRRAARRTLAESASVLGGIESTLSGLRVVKAYNAEGFERRRLRGTLDRLLSSQRRLARVDALSTPVMETLVIVATVTVVIIATVFVVRQGSLSPSSFVLVAFCLVQIGESLRRVSKLNVVIQRANAAAERIFEGIDAPAEGRERHDGHLPPVLPPRRQIAFEDVHFRYGPDQPAALDGVTLRVSAGQRVAVVGRNGSGKTTLLSLLPRFADPDAGRVTFDGRDVRDYSLRSLRRLVTVVTQDAVIFPGTFADNVAYGRPSASREEVELAAGRGGAHDFILRRPGGYDAILTGPGGGLSGGQRQRIALARAFLRDTPVLILDEATSQVDAESERLIQQAIEALTAGRTTFVIAHRFSTIVGCDRIAVMDAGRLVAEGTHEELLETSGIYRALYERQLVVA